WALGLSSLLFIDRVYKKPEEGRYTYLRDIWKTWILLKFFFFFQVQTVLNLFLTIPFFLLAIDPSPNEWLIYIGATLSLIGIAGETTADLQLKFFKSKPTNKGKICQVGLWN